MTLKEAREFVKAQPAAQVFAPVPRSTGKVTSPALNHVWQADLIDYSAKNPDSNNGFRFALVVIDVFSRKAFSEPLKTKTPEEVLAAYKVILGRAGASPKRLSTDGGREFKGTFEEFLESQNTAHLIKEQINHLAVVDATIKTLKDIMKKDLTDSRSENWTKALSSASQAINTNSHPALMNSAPNDVKGSTLLQYALEKKAGEDMIVNNTVHTERLRKLREAGEFRIVLPRSTWVRAGQPRYGDKVYKVDHISGPTVVATDGTQVPIRDALPVPAGSSNTVVPRALRGGRPGTGSRSRCCSGTRPFCAGRWRRSR